VPRLFLSDFLAAKHHASLARLAKVQVMPRYEVEKIVGLGARQALKRRSYLSGTSSLL
jgi:hypothetical protein